MARSTWPSTVLSLFAGTALLLSTGCGGDDGGPSGPDDGSIAVTVSTTGSDLDPDGYVLSMAGESDRAIAVNGSATFSGVATGQHSVQLSGLAANCSVTGDNPATVSVSAGSTAQVAFQVACAALGGSVQVTVSTTGQDLDPDGYTVTIDGGSDRSIGLNGVTTYTGVSAGSHPVELAGLADNCAVSGSNPATASVTAGETAQLSFDVVCEALPIGSLEITTTVANNFDPDGFQVLVAGMSQGTVEVNGSATFDDLPSGAQQVELTGIAPNCVVDGDNPVSIDITTGGSASHGFAVTCTSPPDGRILVFYNGLTVMNADGSGRFLLAPLLGSTIEWGVWSRDGEKIAFSSNANTGNGHDIYVMNKDGSGRVQVTTDPAHDLDPAFSPDGASIAFTSERTGKGEIFVVASDGTGITQLTSDLMLANRYPSWSPDGGRIVFNRIEDFGSMNADFAISVMDADGSNITRLNQVAPICDQGFNAGFPAWRDANPQWSPDGTRILFQRNFFCTGDPVTDEPDIFVMDTDGSNVTNLTNSPGHEGTPRWSPDGTRIVFYTSDGVSIMNADGSGVTQIAANGAGGFHERPVWGP